MTNMTFFDEESRNPNFILYKHHNEKENWKNAPSNNLVIPVIVLKFHLVFKAKNTY